MAFRAFLVSKSPETDTAMADACRVAGVRVESCSDIFQAIEKGKTRAFSCLIVDWADQPEASFLLKRARESAANRETIAIAIVDHEPTAAEMHDNRLDFLIYRPISPQEAQEVLAKASENMKPLGAEDSADSLSASGSGNSVATPGVTETLSPMDDSDAHSSVETAVDEETGGSDIPSDIAISGAPRHAIGLREVFAVALTLTAAFCLWRSSAVIEYLAHTPEGGYRVLRESVAALFYVNQSGALPVGSAGSDAQQDAYFSRGGNGADTQAPTLGLASSESSMAEGRLPLPKPPDFPLPVPVFEPPIPQPVHVARAPIPDSMRNSPPIAPPVVVTVTPAQMMPVSVPQSQQIGQSLNQPSGEPVAMTEDAARARLVHSVDPVYPTEALPQKLHGPVTLQAVIGRDGSVEDLKLVHGYFILGKAAIAAVKQWRFQPYSSGGHAASTQTTITVNFNSPPG